MDDDHDIGLGGSKPTKTRRPEIQSRLVTNEGGMQSTPQHIDAEQALIASCIHDETFETLIKSDRQGVTINSFYKPSHQIIWSAMLAMYKNDIAIDLVTITQKISDTGQLDDIGGVTYLNEVADRVETHAHAIHYIDIVIEMATRRALIRASQQMIEGAQEAKSMSKLEEIAGKMEYHLSKMEVGSDFELKPITDFKTPPADSPDRLIGKFRYICRGAASMLVGSAGIGKSSMIIQMCAAWGCGRDFLGILCAKPLRILLIQAEDDDGDIGEVWDSVRAGLKLSHDEMNMLRENFVIVRDKVNSGEAFLRKLPQYIEAHNPDLVVLNPLLSFIGGAIDKQEVMSAFLRNGLNRINKDDKFAYLLVHHTNKPQKNDGKSDTNWTEWMYKMSGSAELANYPRAIMIIEPAKDEGKFWLRLAKRGNRAGVIAQRGEPNNPHGPSYEPTIKLAVKHSRETQKLEDGRKVPMILWERIKENTEEYHDMVGSGSDDSKRGRKVKNAPEDVLDYIGIGRENAKGGAQIYRASNEGTGITKTKFYGLLKKLYEDEEIIKDGDNRYYKS